jgi:hypothetical protein
MFWIFKADRDGVCINAGISKTYKHIFSSCVLLKVSDVLKDYHEFRHCNTHHHGAIALGVVAADALGSTAS